MKDIDTYLTKLESGEYLTTKELQVLLDKLESVVKVTAGCGMIFKGCYVYAVHHITTIKDILQAREV